MDYFIFYGILAIAVVLFGILIILFKIGMLFYDIWMSGGLR